jgi:putative ABC transport system ATP-binding protein
MSPSPQVEKRITGGAVQCEGLLVLFPVEGGQPVVALRNVYLDVAPGEMLALLGPSGSGKSTLLAVLAGLLRPTAGRILVAGHDLASIDAQDAIRLRATKLSLVLQDASRNLLPYGTAAQNVVFAQRGARRRGWPLSWGPVELLETLGLGSLADLPAHRLSAGEQQRVALATAVSTSPGILLVDEPTSNLDPQARQATTDLLWQINDLTGVTVVVVTHDASTASALPRTVTIRSGQVGTEGRRGQQYVVVNGDGTVSLPPEVLAEYPPGSLFSVRRRAEGVELRREQP